VSKTFYMQLLRTIPLLLISLTVAYAQPGRAFERAGEVRFSDAEGAIQAYKLLDRGTKLTLVGSKVVRVVDVNSANVISFRVLEIPDQSEENPRMISPDGRRILVFGNYNFKDKANKVRRDSAIWDLQTGKQIAVLNRPVKPVRAGLWSRNGKILATSSDRYAPHFTDDRSIEVSFWDGETFQYLSSLPADKINWWHLSNDGSKCFYSTAPITNWLFIVKFIGFRGGPINVWDIRRGQMDQTLSVSEVATLTNTQGMTVSPDGHYLTYIADRPKAKDPEKRLVVREIEPNGSTSLQVKPKYELSPAPKLPEYGVQFSGDGEYFVFDAGKTLQIYETKSGQKKFELQKDDPPTQWLNDNKILLYSEGDEIVGRDIATGTERYRHKVIYYSYTYYANSEDTIPVTEVSDYTRIVPHPNGKVFLTYSNQYVKVHDALTGIVLQTLVEPPIDPTKRVDPRKGPRLSSKPLVKSAAWGSEGKVIYIISYDESAVSFWRRSQ
jgi:hypothetical protein